MQLRVVARFRPTQAHACWRVRKHNYCVYGHAEARAEMQRKTASGSRFRASPPSPVRLPPLRIRIASAQISSRAEERLGEAYFMPQTLLIDLYFATSRCGAFRIYSPMLPQCRTALKVRNGRRRTRTPPGHLHQPSVMAPRPPRLYSQLITATTAAIAAATPRK